jgi:predicted nucleic acid-binding protein
LADEARLVLEHFLGGLLDLKAPRLIIYEVGNTLWKAARQGLITDDEALQKFSHFLALKIGSICLNADECKGVLKWGLENGATYYDSMYVKACSRAKAILLTADDTLYNKSHRATPAIHLRDYRRKTTQRQSL